MDLKSRYGDVWSLQEITADDKIIGYLWNPVPGYTRFGFFPDDENDISFIDPPGGPFLEVGREIKEGETITEIRDLGDEEGVLIKIFRKEG